MNESIFCFHTQAVFANLGKTNNLGKDIFLKTENIAGRTIYRRNEQKYHTDGGVSFKFWSSQSAGKGLHFKVCRDTSTPCRLHHYRQYFRENMPREQLLALRVQCLKSHRIFENILWSSRSLAFLHNPLKRLCAHLDWNSSFFSNYRLLFFFYKPIRASEFWMIVCRDDPSYICDSFVSKYFSVVPTLFCFPAVAILS